MSSRFAMRIAAVGLNSLDLDLVFAAAQCKLGTYATEGKSHKTQRRKGKRTWSARKDAKEPPSWKPTDVDKEWHNP